MKLLYHDLYLHLYLTNRFCVLEPQKVSGVKTEAETKTIERVKWKSVQGARSYSVVFGDLQGTLGEEETQDNEILLTNLQPATQHFVRISANGRGGSGRPSDKVFFQTGTRL